jgi:hypothetical protein
MCSEVRDAGGARQLVARADAVPQLEGHDRAAVVLEEQHAQAVVQRDGQDRIGGRGGRRRGQPGHEQDEGDEAAHRFDYTRAVTGGAVTRNAGVTASAATAPASATAVEIQQPAAKDPVTSRAQPSTTGPTAAPITQIML